MFTIKHIDESGMEHLWTAEHPSYGKNGVFTSEVDGETKWVKGGIVYVMNEGGKTVACYHLAPSGAYEVQSQTSVASGAFDANQIEELRRHQANNRSPLVNPSL